MLLKIGYAQPPRSSGSGEALLDIRELAQAFPPVTIYSYCAAFLAVSIYLEFGPVVLVYELTMLSCNIYNKIRGGRLIYDCISPIISG